MADVQHFDVSFDCTNLEKSTIEIIKLVRPLWDTRAVVVKRFTEGMCNVMVGCYLEEDADKDDMVMIRVNGENTDIIIDRAAEKVAILFLSQKGFSPPVYCTFNNGIVYGYVKGTTLDQDMVRDDRIRCLIAKKMALLHSLRKSSTPPGGVSSELPSKLKSYISIIPESFSKEDRQQEFLRNKETLVAECSTVLEHLNTLKCDVVLCHNDLLLNNIIYDKHHDKLGFIDFEYTFYNWQAFDIGDHFTEYGGTEATIDYSKYPDKEYQLSWIRVYLDEYNRLVGRQAPGDEEIEVMYKEAKICSMAAHIFWALCSLYQAEHSLIVFQWIKYAATRLKMYYQLKKELFG